jgi:hypothetical protein
MGLGSDILSFLGIVLSSDQSGAAAKFSYFSKLLSRLRYINLNYGDVFGNFLRELGKSFDKKHTDEIDSDIKKKPPEEIIKAVRNYKEKQEFLHLLSNGHRAKFN